MKSDRSRLGFAVFLIGLCLVLGTASLVIGTSGISPLDSMAGIFGQADPITNIVVQEIRLPRTLLCLLVGGALGLSGAVLQGYLRNPLADPAFLGISSSGALGAVLALYFGVAAR